MVLETLYAHAHIRKPAQPFPRKGSMAAAAFRKSEF